jgi:hypothetical protein
MVYPNVGSNKSHKASDPRRLHSSGQISLNAEGKAILSWKRGQRFSNFFHNFPCYNTVSPPLSFLLCLIFISEKSNRRLNPSCSVLPYIYDYTVKTSTKWSRVRARFFKIFLEQEKGYDIPPEDWYRTNVCNTKVYFEYKLSMNLGSGGPT